MAVSEEDVKEQEIIEEDFKKAQEIMDRIEKHMGKRMARTDTPLILFTLCLIYSRQLKQV